MDTRGGYDPVDNKSLLSDGNWHHNHHDNLHHHHHHHHPLFHQVAKFVLLFAVILVTCFVLHFSAHPFQLLPRSSYSQAHTKFSFSYAPRDPKLEKLLEKAAMADKTVILTTLNGAWAAPNAIFDVFLESFKIGIQTKKLLKHLVVIALDQNAYDRCLALHPFCYVLRTTGIDFSGEAYFMVGNYLEMMWRRIDFLRSVLEMGYNFVFTDTDVMWFRDPFPHFYPDADFQIACDIFRGNPLDLNNNANGGFSYVKSNNRTIKFYKFWHKSRENFPGHDQDVFNRIKFDPYFSRIGLKVRFFDTIYFGGFCQPSKDLNLVYTMHANCCFGLDAKGHDLRVMLEDWRKYLSSPANVRASRTITWTVPQNCSNNIKDFHPPALYKMINGQRRS